MEVTFEDFITGFREYVDSYGYEPDEIRTPKSWARDYLSYLEFEEKTEEETKK